MDKLCATCRGACCEEMYVKVEPRDYFDAEWLEARLGPRIARRCLPSAPGGCAILEVILEERCPHLTEGALGGLCGIWGEEQGQPAACRLAPVLGDECRDSLRRRRPILWAALVADGRAE